MFFPKYLLLKSLYCFCNSKYNNDRTCLQVEKLQKTAEEKVRASAEVEKSKADLESKVSTLEVNLQVLGDTDLIILQVHYIISNERDGPFGWYPFCSEMVQQIQPSPQEDFMNTLVELWVKAHVLTCLIA